MRTAHVVDLGRLAEPEWLFGIGARGGCLVSGVEGPGGDHRDTGDRDGIVYPRS